MPERFIDAMIDGAPYRVRIDGADEIGELRPLADQTVDLRLTTGFLDLHGHGGAGHSYDDADATGLAEALELHRVHGTTRLLLSLVSAPPARLARRLDELRALVPAFPGVVGVHLEGPFLAPSRRGAHDPGALREPSPASVDALLEAGQGILRQITIAPELPGALDAIDRFVAAGVVVAIGHTEASYEEASAALDRGAGLVTHGFNAMPGLGHRDPGPLGAALAREHVTIEVIADGIHVHPVVLRTLFAAAAGRVALVSDSMAATGLGDGEYRLGALDVSVRAGRPVVIGTETLAGSTLTLDRAVAVAVAAGVPVDEAITAATTVPSSALGLDPAAVGPRTPLSAVVAVDASGMRVDLAAAGARPRP